MIKLRFFFLLDFLFLFLFVCLFLLLFHQEDVVNVHFKSTEPNSVIAR